MADMAAGDVVVTEGDPGDLFYVIADGEVEVTRGGRRQGTLGEGEQFGEIALLRDSNRTATVIATRPTRLVTIDGRDFVDAVSSSEAAFLIGSRVADELLSRDQTNEPSLCAHGRNDFDGHSWSHGSPPRLGEHECRRT